MVYGLTNVCCIVAYREHHMFTGIKHMVIPVFGALANFACMAFYIIGPIEGLGSVKEPLMAVAISVVWGALRSFLLHAQLQEARKGYALGQSKSRLIESVPPLCGSASPKWVLRGPGETTRTVFSTDLIPSRIRETAGSQRHAARVVDALDIDNREGSFPFLNGIPTGADVPKLGDRSAPSCQYS